MIDGCITNCGEAAEAQFCALTGAVRARQKCPDGDAVLDGHFVEIKATASNQINAVRPLKYLPLCVLMPDGWYVIPPNVIVHLASRKTRGQFTENPFESCQFTMDWFKGWRVADADLRRAVLAAIAEGESWPALKAEMARTLADARWLADEAIRCVTAASAAGPTAPAVRPPAVHQLSFEVAA